MRKLKITGNRRGLSVKLSKEDAADLGVEAGDDLVVVRVIRNRAPVERTGDPTEIVEDTKLVFRSIGK
ncbi:MAG: hypothetical protein ACFBSD_16635 [Paracoccaceae bacterium]